MARRNRMTRHFVDIHGLRGGPEPSLNRDILGPVPVNLVVALEEELEIQHIENRRIAAENQHMLHGIVNLEREVVSAKGEIHRLDELIVNLRADNNVKYRDLIERELKLEADLRTTEPLREEVLHFRAETQKLNVVKQDLTGQIQGLVEKIARLRSENDQLYTLRAHVDAVREKLAEARRELEYEKKANQELVEQKGAIEKNLISMAHEIEELRAERMSMDMRGHGLGGGSSYAMPNIRYPGEGAPDDRYGGAWGPYSKHPGH
ncbi:protein FLX-like 3 isoform X2 [Amaranthus tricolor]|nr:protein FLX-like 3 isoform X2 [Amaranthus tricolor]XP_057528676.1 protein FLX-like 3 isoform X2 [Amaranthus tricolor]XP_057528677.1 protein FLX-like 3 isoform X2 [Amaranthus tricolor]XP_057528678.1 protein FLX-like 3 isoform X2 [Amaranthus tricolor]XP_057528679.1 protein FLX-like 3 isoform X2 [Amaranthus tricolor]